MQKQTLHPPTARPDTSPQPALLQSQHLLDGRTSVTIEHNGQRYCLQTTRAGKLILTK